MSYIIHGRTTILRREVNAGTDQKFKTGELRTKQQRWENYGTRRKAVRVPFCWPTYLVRHTLIQSFIFHCSHLIHYRQPNAHVGV